MVGLQAQYQVQRRRSWARRHKVLIALGIIGAVLVAAGVLKPMTSSPPDYHDTAQLARAVRAQEQAAEGSNAVSGVCLREVLSGIYTCSVGFADLTVGSYLVKVAPDGRSYTVSNP